MMLLVDTNHVLRREIAGFFCFWMQVLLKFTLINSKSKPSFCPSLSTQFNSTSPAPSFSQHCRWMVFQHNNSTNKQINSRSSSISGCNDQHGCSLPLLLLSKTINDPQLIKGREHRSAVGVVFSTTMSIQLTSCLSAGEHSTTADG